MAHSVWGLSPLWITVVVAVVLLGGFVRGFGGFGSSMVWVTGMSLALPPSSVVPTVLMLEILASLQMLPKVWRDIHWHSLRWLLVGALVGLPFGTIALVSLSDRPMRILIGAVVLLAALLMASGWQRDRLPGARGGVATGVVSGVLDGAFAIGGPPAVLMYFSATQYVIAGRASLVFFFLYTDVVGTVSASVGGLVTPSLLGQVAVLFPLSLAGVAAGTLWFRRVGVASFRTYVLWTLAALSCLTLLQAVSG